MHDLIPAVDQYREENEKLHVGCGVCCACWSGWCFAWCCTEGLMALDLLYALHRWLYGVGYLISRRAVLGFEQEATKPSTLVFLLSYLSVINWLFGLP